MARVAVVKGFLVLLMSAGWVLAVPEEPAGTALRYVEKVRDKQLDLTPGKDTALSPQTTEGKRKEIARRLERLAGDLNPSSLEVGPVRTDGEFAGVLIRKFHGFNAQSLAVVPVALVRRGVDWLAAPVPASFENVGVGFDQGLRQRLRNLEEWMLREQAVDLAQLKAEAGQRMRRKIEERITVEALMKLEARQVAERFVSACERRDEAELLGLMGGLEADPPGDWNVRMNAVDGGIGQGTRSLARPWRLLGAQEVLRVPLFQDEDEDAAYAVYACLDPKGFPDEGALPQVEIVRLNLSKSAAGLWRVDPPSAFLQVDEEVDFLGEDSLDSKLLGMFPAKLALKYPLEPETSAEKAAEALQVALASPNPAGWARLVQFKGETEEVCESYAKTAAFWWRANDATATRAMVPLDFNEQGAVAVSACQFFDSRHPDQFDLQFLYFEKTPMGWLWNPLPTNASTKAMEEWIGGQATKWEEVWQDRMLAENAKIDGISGPAPDVEPARKLVNSWCEASHRRDLKSALGLATRLDTPDSSTNALRNLGYEFAGSKLNPRLPEITAVKRGVKITAVGVKSASDGKPLFPFYAVVGTPLGPRILLEVDLAVSESRTREYLNEVSLKRLRKTDPEAAEELQKLYAEFRAEVGLHRSE